jgi:hypothetical protein
MSSPIAKLLATPSDTSPWESFTELAGVPVLEREQDRIGVVHSKEKAKGLDLSELDQTLVDLVGLRNTRVIGQLVSPHENRQDLKPPSEFFRVLAEARAQSRIRELSRPVRVGSLRVPEALRNVGERVSRFRTSLTEFDAEIEGCCPPSEATSRRAIRFVLTASMRYWEATRCIPPAPAISPGPEGSVDVVWRMKDRLVAANVPEDPGNVVTLYGRDRSRPHRRLRAEEDPELSSAWILDWLMQ